ncbi:hypothetical protein ACVIHH_001269 [Bradyrhizobium sp. USDA 4518]
MAESNGSFRRRFLRLFVPAETKGPAPVMAHFNGLDGLKEFLFLSGFPNALARRGVSALVVEKPGVGEPLRKLGLHIFAEVEVPASACIDLSRNVPGRSNHS